MVDHSNDDVAPETNALLELYLSTFRWAADIHSREWPDDDGLMVELEGLRQTFRLANAGHLMHLEGDPAYPLLIKNQSLQRQMQLPSVDAVYHWAPIHGDYTYRIRGQRGSAHIFQLAVYEGSSSAYPDFRVISERDNFEDDSLGPNKEVDIVLSKEKQAGVWFPLPDGPGELYIRQYYYDWDREQPADLWIEREGAPYPPPPLGSDQLSDGVRRAASWLEVQSRLYRNYVESFVNSDPSYLPAISIPGAFEGTKYLNGHYRCGVGEAVILEVETPQAPYWGFQLSNLQWEALDYYMRQTSINGHQARADDDGVFRAVISHQDPGVPNWLDTGGRKLGLISGRYFKAETAPSPKLKVVPFNDVFDHLPSTTPRVSAEERQQHLRQRLLSTHRRRCSDQ